MTTEPTPWFEYDKFHQARVTYMNGDYILIHADARVEAKQIGRRTLIARQQLQALDFVGEDKDGYEMLFIGFGGGVIAKINTTRDHLLTLLRWFTNGQANFNP